MTIPSAKKSRGRPKVDAVPVNVRVPPDLVADLDRWISDQPEPKPSRPEALRTLAAERLIATSYRAVPTNPDELDP